MAPAYDHARSRKPITNVDVEMVGDRMTADTPDSDFGIDFAEALKILKEEERTAVLLYYMEDHPIDKISKIMGCPSGTVKSHLHRGKEKLAKYFRSENIERG